jgi:hypothetical protein
MSILNSITTKKTKTGKSIMTSGDKFQVTIKYNGKTCTMVYNDNYKNSSGTNDFIFALMSDALAYIETVNLRQFADNYGYDYYEYAQDAEQQQKNLGVAAIYNACKRQYTKFNRMFTKAEQQKIADALSDY